MDVTIPRRPKFEIKISVNKLTNLPQMSGLSWIRWYIKDSAKPDARGKTEKFPVKEHQVLYHDVQTSFTHHIRVNSQNVLRECIAVFEVLWAQSSSGDKVTLGRAEANLSEYVNQAPQSTRFLLRESKVNCTLSLTFDIKQVSGSKNYKVPPPTSKVFGDISTTLNTDISSTSKSATSISSNSFAVTWCSVLQGEYDPKTCIDDIFNGGCGMKNSDLKPGASHSKPRQPLDPHSSVKGAVTGQSDKPGASHSSRADMENAKAFIDSFGGKRPDNGTSFGHMGPKKTQLLSEEDIREDLRSWKINYNHIKA